MSPIPPLSSASSSRSDLSLDLSDHGNYTAVPHMSPTIAQGSDSGLAPLQISHGEPEGLDPIGGEDGLEADSFNLVKPNQNRQSIPVGKHKLEQRSELLFSTSHLQAIFDRPACLHQFSDYLYRHRQTSIPLLKYYLEALKALRALEYSNAVVRGLGLLPGPNKLNGSPPETLGDETPCTVNDDLRNTVNAAFEMMVQQDLPMYITHVWIQTVSVSIRHRIVATPPRHLHEGLAEVFCLTDPSRTDNPIVFMSEEFNKTTQYGVDYVIGRNCRFLQGPCTNLLSVARIREKLAAGMEHYETFLNYRRDGSPFMNLVMLAPLYDSRGTIRYFLGAQVDVSGLAMDCFGLDALKDLTRGPTNIETSPPTKDEFVLLAETLGPQELDAVTNHGGDMYRHIRLQAEIEHARQNDNDNEASADSGALPKYSAPKAKRVLLRDPDSPTQAPVTLDKGDIPTLPTSLAINHNGRLAGVYEHYLLVRPYPSLRILFTSPSMRIPGILQSPLMDRIGSSLHTRQQLVEALAGGQAVTAKVRWLSGNWYNNNKANSTSHRPLDSHQGAEGHVPERAGKSRWLHCTPLVGNNGKVGVWMIVIVDGDDEADASEQVKTAKHVVKESTSSDNTRVESALSQRIQDTRSPSAASQRPFEASPRPPSVISHRPSESFTQTWVPDFPLPLTLLENQAESVAAPPSIKSQRSIGGFRTPRMPRIPLLDSGGRFFSRDVLSRAATDKADEEAKRTTKDFSQRIKQMRIDTRQRREAKFSVPSLIQESPGAGEREDGASVFSKDQNSLHSVRI